MTTQTRMVTRAVASATARSLLAALAPNKAVSESLIFMGPTAAAQPP